MAASPKFELSENPDSKRDPNFDQQQGHSVRNFSGGTNIKRRYIPNQSEGQRHRIEKHCTPELDVGKAVDYGIHNWCEGRAKVGLVIWNRGRNAVLRATRKLPPNSIQLMINIIKIVNAVLSALFIPYNELWQERTLAVVDAMQYMSTHAKKYLRCVYQGCSFLIHCISPLNQG